MRQILLPILGFLTCLLCYNASADQGIDGFVKVSSGIRTTVPEIREGDDGSLFMLSGKIYQLRGQRWESIETLTQGRIYAFCPVTSSDIWFTINQVTNTSLLYHMHDGITELIRSPFANQIVHIGRLDRETIIFTSYSDIALYRKGIFRMLPPIPTRYSVIKTVPDGNGQFFLLTNGNELFIRSKGQYRRILPGTRIRDIAINHGNMPVMLAGDSLGTLIDRKWHTFLKSRELSEIGMISADRQGGVWMVGHYGTILRAENGNLKKFNTGISEHLIGLLITRDHDIWAYGEKGMLLYYGQRNFPGVTETTPGFSAVKLIPYSINTDDEYGVAISDFNGDGRPDIYTVRIFEQNRLYINIMNTGVRSDLFTGFVDEAGIRNALGVPESMKGRTSGDLKLGIVAFDADNDNHRDIYLCYLNSNNRLLLNRGNGYFRNVSHQPNRATPDLKRSNAAAVADIDLDGDLDLFVTSEEGSNKLFLNNGTGTFTDVTAVSGLSSVSGGMCAAFSDVDGDGLPDLCVSFWYPGNKLYKNISSGDRIAFLDITAQTDLRLAPPAKSNGITFGDMNNDGAPDLFIANRTTGNRLYINDGKGFFRDCSDTWLPGPPTMSNGGIMADFDLDGFTDLYVTNVGENIFYRNINGERLEDATANFGAGISGYSTGGATADVDDDGDPDLYVGNYINGNSMLMLNMTDNRNFVKIRLRGVIANRDAIGAKIWLYQEQPEGKPAILAGYREVTAGGGYASSSDPEQIFGVRNDMNYHARILYPGSRDTLLIEDITSGFRGMISEINGFRAFWLLSRDQLVRFFIDPENQPEIMKTMAILIMIVLYLLKYKGDSRNVRLIRLSGAGFIFILFIFINRFYLFTGISSPGYYTAPAISLGLILLMHLITGRVLQHRLAIREKAELREKLSRDLHDDLASTLGSISIYANTLNSLPGQSGSDFKRLAAKVTALTQTALQSISDIIWMTSPRNDSLQSLISKSGNYMMELLTDNNIAFDNRVDIVPEPISMPEAVRNNVFLIIKEAVHNIIRHSGATSVTFVAEVHDSVCCLEIRDNGKGVEQKMASGEHKGHGHGLENMRRRAKESGLEFSILSGPGKGTSVAMKFRI